MASTKIRSYSGNVDIDPDTTFIVNTDALYADSSTSRIGVGTNNPGATLDITGSVDASSLEVNGVTNSHIPIGFIILWYGTIASIPTGWGVCDGTTYARSDGGGNIVSPNLSGEFVVSHGPTYAVGASGGNTNATLSVNTLPSHNHNGRFAGGGTHDHYQRLGNTDDRNFSGPNGQRPPSDGPGSLQFYNISSSGSGHAHNMQVNPAGNTQAFPILPAYRNLAYIMKI